MEKTLKIREDRCRRALAKRGYVLRKTPARSWQRKHFDPGYMIVDAYTNTVAEGACEREFDADLARVEWFTFEHLDRKASA
jgi:hypothetical protein